MKLPIYLLALTSSLLHAQGGSLTPPPGAPAPTMKSLAHIEARTALVEGANGVTIDSDTGGITITAPGSYYLTGNLTVSEGHGITINTPRVTVDLNGFTISSTANPAAGSGLFSQEPNITVSNGHVVGDFDTFDLTGSGFQHGVNLVDYNAIHVFNMTVSGVSGDGIRTQSGQSSCSLIASCQVSSVGEYGIKGTVVKNCVVRNSVNDGIFATMVESCRAISINGRGIFANQANNCYGKSDTKDGISATVVNNCTGESNSGNGIKGVTVSHSRGTTFSGHGIDATQLASHCTARAYHDHDGKFGIRTDTAVGCYAIKVSADHKFNMP